MRDQWGVRRSVFRQEAVECVVVWGKDEEGRGGIDKGRTGHLVWECSEGMVWSSVPWKEFPGYSWGGLRLQICWW